MGMDTVKRFDRIVAILIQLQTKRIVKAQELADRFDVSLRTIYRDIRTLEASGVPIASEAGVGYSIMEGYRLPPVMFTREEAGSFVAAEKLMQKFTDRSLGAYYESAMFKLKSVLRGKEKDWVEALESQVSIVPGEVLFNEKVPNALEILFESIAERKQVFLRYESLREEAPSERRIEPVGLFHENGYWYILGYCHLRTDYRHFRTDRIHKITRTSQDFLLKHGTMDEHRNKREEMAKTKVKIAVDRAVAKFIQGQTKYYGLVSSEIKGHEVEMTFMTTDWKHGFARWFLMFGDCAKIIEPDMLRERVAEILEKTQERLSR
ncbi:helix-turn-helix transcriptional regulator [Flagellimonas crocea]|uniref:helix-turn-helix transcriptional regulator n=1 Tax=Flagellimonas crocea TaxID=3067311 RepID=UPI00296F0A72|nr:YafY family protein [Muricauda sp. DH64]